MDGVEVIPGLLRDYQAPFELGNGATEIGLRKLRDVERGVC